MNTVTTNVFKVQHYKRQTRLSDEFIRELAGFSAGYLSTENFEELLSLFNKELKNLYFTRSSESNLLRILGGIYDKSAFLMDCIRYPHHTEILTSIAANSNYLTDILVRNPEYFYWIVNPSRTSYQVYKENIADAINSLLNSYKTLQARLNALKAVKRREVLILGTADILGMADLETITDKLSTLSTAITSEVFNLAYKEILSRHDIKSTSRKFCMIALGKLGGHELNYSSDIDLIIFYDKESKIKGKYYSEILTESVLLFIECMSAITSAGFLYRVDFRLRPDGRNSPLCRSVSEYLNYYETRGEDWERQMLIKAGYVCGNRELYSSFMNYLTPFIYPSSFSYSPTEQIKRLKKNIESKLGEAENIKLIPGGIRDIEFSVQALQLINGGKIKEIRTGNTLNAIEKLKNAELLSPAEAKEFNVSYRLYRRAEHFLQLMNDRQTHIIPSEGEVAEKLAVYLGFNGIKDMQTAFARRRKSVRKIYNSVMGISDEDYLTVISEIKFSNRKKAANDLDYLREGKDLLGNKKFDKESISSFDGIEESLLNYLQHCSNPDRVLSNFVRIISFANFPSIWYREFSDIKFFNSFLRLCEFGQMPVDIFANDKKIRELFLSRQVFGKLTAKKEVEYDIKTLSFILAVQFILGICDSKNVSDILSINLKCKISSAGKKLEEMFNDNDVMIAGLGSLGNDEFSFNSDIDLIFIFSDESLNAASEKYVQKFLADLRSEMPGIEVDCRLRPEGKSSQLAWSIGSYENYILSRARIWELQAFTKCSFIWGNSKIFTRLKNSLHKRLQKENSETVFRELSDMRKKLYPRDISSIANVTNLKKSRGGWTDIEFICQYYLLCNPGLFKKTMGKSPESILEMIAPFGTDKNLSDELTQTYRKLKHINMTNQIMFNSSNSNLPLDRQMLKELAVFLGHNSEEELNTNLKKLLKFNANKFENLKKLYEL